MKNLVLIKDAVIRMNFTILEANKDGVYAERYLTGKRIFVYSEPDINKAITIFASTKGEVHPFIALFKNHTLKFYDTLSGELLTRI